MNSDERPPTKPLAPAKGNPNQEAAEVTDQLQRLLLALAAVEQQAKLLTHEIETEMERLGFTGDDISRLRNLLVWVSVSLGTSLT